MHFSSLQWSSNLKIGLGESSFNTTFSKVHVTSFSKATVRLRTNYRTDRLRCLQGTFHLLHIELDSVKEAVKAYLIHFKIV